MHVSAVTLTTERIIAWGTNSPPVEISHFVHTMSFWKSFIMYPQSRNKGKPNNFQQQ